MKVDLLLLANDRVEHDYIEEFVNYYLDVIGIDTIHLIDDIATSDMPLCDFYPIRRRICDRRIKYYQLTQPKKQERIYDEFYQEHKNEFDWLCIFDTDEFLVLKQHSNINEFLSQDVFNDCDQVLVNWKIYFENGHISKPVGRVMDNFTMDSNSLDSGYVKCIVRGGLDNVYCHVHVFGDGTDRNGDGSLTPISTKHSNGNTIHESEYIGTAQIAYHEYDTAQLNHYMFKSLEEFLTRKLISNNYLIISYEDVITTLFTFPDGWYNYIPTIMWTEQKQIYVKHFINNHES